MSAPLPDFELADRVGPLPAGEDPLRFYVEYGRRIRDDLVALLPQDWDWRRKRVLDFGCGAGRTLRHLLDEARVAELHGCDIDPRSIAWLERYMSPPLHVFVNAERPPLERPGGYFDLVYAVSVFTHLTDDWAAWLVELHRILKPGGLLIATFLGEGVSEVVTGERFDERRIGMNVLNHGQPWDEGGPTVLHSPWWIRAHWGRAFDVVELRPHGFAADQGIGHGVTVMRKLGPAPSVEALEALEPGEPREIEALRHNIQQLAEENRKARAALSELQSSESWRLTAPLRAVKRMLARR